MSLSFLQSATDGTSQTTYTFSSQNLGTAASDRYIIVTITGRSGDGADKTLDSATIGGVSATIAGSSQWNSGNVAGVICAAVPSGTTGDITITFSASMTDCCIGAYRVTNLASATALSSAGATTDAGAMVINIKTGGVAVAIAKDDDGSATCTWTGLTEDFDTASGDSNDIAGASKEFTTSPNVSVTTNLSVNADWTGVPTRPVAFTASYQINETLTPVTANASVQAPTVTGSANVSTTVITANASVQAPTISTPANDWTNQTRNTSGSYTNQTKN